jgi:rubrerythrin
VSSNDHGSCPSCSYNFNGSFVWDHFYKETGSEEEATRIAEMYGASKGHGRFGKQIGIYDSDKDRTTQWMCPSCEYTWER